MVGADRPMTALNMYKQYTLKSQRDITPIKWSQALTFLIKLCFVSMNVFARFNALPLMTLKVIKETKRCLTD